MRERSLYFKEIEEALRREPGITSKISVEINNRNVLIGGVVATLEEKNLAEKIVKSFGPVRLENNIVIESARIIGDAEVFNSAREAIKPAPGLIHNIGVDRVVNGIVYLGGKSESIGYVKMIAEMVARAPGVRDLVSEVKIETSMPLENSDIVNETMQALSEERSIREEFIEVAVKNGIVYLSGSIEKPEQKMLAAAIVQRLPGVLSVVNNLETPTSPNSLDKALENEAIKAIEANKIDMRSMNISVLDGVAFLDGTVTSIRQRDHARAIAEAIVGIRFVQDNLSIAAHTESKER